MNRVTKELNMNHCLLNRLQPRHLPPLGENPLVSVLVANYNYARFLPEALESALRQTYSNLEIIVCDDGSTDNSCEVVERYATRDARVNLMRKTNGGVASALNAAYSMARGDLLALLDADDTWLPNRLELVVEAFQRQPPAGMVTHALQVMDHSGRVLGGRFPGRLSLGWLGPSLVRGGDVCFPPASGLTFRRPITDVAFPIPGNFRKLADAVLRDRAAMLAHVGVVRETAGMYRIHANNITGIPLLPRTIREVDEALAARKQLSEARIEFALQVLGIDPRDTKPLDLGPLLAFRAFLNGEHLGFRQVARDVTGTGHFLRAGLIWAGMLIFPQSVGRMVFFEKRHHTQRNIVRRRTWL